MKEQPLHSESQYKTPNVVAHPIGAEATWAHSSSVPTGFPSLASLSPGSSVDNAMVKGVPFASHQHH